MPKLVLKKEPINKPREDNRVRVTQETMDIINEFSEMTNQPKIQIVEKMIKFAAKHAIIEETVSYEVRWEE